MTLKKTLYTILISALAACNSSENRSDEPSPELTEVKHDRFQNGWYAVINEKGGIPMQLHGGKETFTIDPTEIATQKNFRSVAKVMGGGCNGLSIQVDSTGAEALYLARQFLKSKKIALILNNELYCVQDVKSESFLFVEKGTPANQYGGVMAIPCNTNITAAELSDIYNKVMEKK